MAAPGRFYLNRATLDTFHDLTSILATPAPVTDISQYYSEKHCDLPQTNILNTDPLTKSPHDLLAMRQR